MTHSIDHTINQPSHTTSRPENCLRTVLMIDDQSYWLTALSTRFKSFPIHVLTAQTAEEALLQCHNNDFDWIICDLKLKYIQGTELIRQLQSIQSHTLYLLLTGYGSVANTVAALKQGIHHVAQKPMQSHEIIHLFLKLESEIWQKEYTLHVAQQFGVEKSYTKTMSQNTLEIQAASLARVEWEHIQRVLDDCQGNISQAARVLGIHRRTLQRKLNILPR